MSAQASRPGSVFRAFLKLGCIAFGGPVAHFGFYEEEFVRKRRWLDAAEYADLVALCQFLPGPSSSQVGFAIGLKRAGIPGAFAAWTGFTLPSAMLMLAFALGVAALGDIRDAGWLIGLKLAAVAVVANAVWNLGAKLCSDRVRSLLAVVVGAALLVLNSPGWQVVMIALGAALGWLWYRRAPAKDSSDAAPAENPAESRGARRSGWPYLTTFFALLLLLPLFSGQATPGGTVAVVDAFYRAGALVFGGGHVVLPLLDAYTVAPGWVERETFLAGYGAAQAVPGPLFTFTAYLGASLSAGPGGIAGGLLALVATYLPSWLLVIGGLPYWERLRRLQAAQAALQGANAAVVGLLLAAFYDPVWSAAVTTPERVAFALVAFGLLRFGKVPPLALVLVSAVAGGLLL
ncbi:MAG: chromate efflux transporter [Opitutales bacterium]